MEILVIGLLALAGVIGYKQYQKHNQDPGYTATGNVITPNETRDAQSAQAALGVALAGATAAISAANPALIPFVAPAAGAVQLSFSRLNTRQKAAIWQGKA